MTKSNFFLVQVFVRHIGSPKKETPTWRLHGILPVQVSQDYFRNDAVVKNTAMLLSRQCHFSLCCDLLVQSDV